MDAKKILIQEKSNGELIITRIDSLLCFDTPTVEIWLSKLQKEAYSKYYVTDKLIEI